MNTDDLHWNGHAQDALLADYILRALVLADDGRTFANKAFPCPRITTPSGIVAKFSFRGWGLRGGAVFSLDTEWTPRIEETHADDVARIRREIAAIAIPTQDGRPIGRVTFSTRQSEQPAMPESDIAWMRAIIETVTPVVDDWNGGEQKSYAVDPRTMACNQGVA